MLYSTFTNRNTVWRPTVSNRPTVNPTVRKPNLPIKRRKTRRNVELRVFRHKKDADAELRRILARAAKAAGVTEEMMRSCSRRQNIAFARHVYCWIATENDYAPETVARLINRRRATVYNSRKEYQNLRGRFQPFDLILQRLGIETEGIKKAS